MAHGSADGSRRGSIRCGVLSVLVIFSIGLVVFVAGVVAATHSRLTRPPRRTYAWALARSRPGEPGELPVPRSFHEWRFSTRGLSLPVWEIPGDRADGPTIVLTHGWGDSRVTMLRRADALARRAARVVTWDMTGHGEAPGACALGLREAEDLGRLIAELRRHEDLKVVLYGFSLGAGVSIAAAASAGPEAVRAVIAEAPYRLAETPARAVLSAAGLPWRWNLPAALWWVGLRNGGWQGFDRAKLAESLRVPLLVIHGDRDAVCPHEDGRAIAEAADGRFELVPEGSHLGLWEDGASSAAVESAVGKFLDHVCGFSGPSAPPPP